MAKLIKCSDCGKKISVNANACPNCGAPAQQSVELDRVNTNAKGVRWSYIIGCFSILLGLLAFRTGVFPAILLIAGGVIALPFARDGLIKRNFTSTNKPLVIISAVLIAIGLISYRNKVESGQLEYMTENQEFDNKELDVDSTNYQMNYMECVQKQNSIKEDILSSGNYKVIPLTETDKLSEIKFCTNDGSVIIICNATDQSIITTQSNNRDGC